MLHVGTRTDCRGVEERGQPVTTGEVAWSDKAREGVMAEGLQAEWKRGDREQAVGPEGAGTLKRRVRAGHSRRGVR